MLWSYMRPEMTGKSIEKITGWNSLSTLTIVIDGLRSAATESEREWREATIRISEKYLSDQVNLLVYDTNIGITDHVNRVQHELLPRFPRAIWVEEDFDLDLARYCEYLEEITIPELPFMSCANGQANHNKINGILRTLFPPYWGQVVNIRLTEEIEKVRQDKVIDEKVVRETLRLLNQYVGFPKHFLFEKQVDYWLNYFKWGVSSPNRWDSVATYVLWKFSTPALVSPVSLITDLAHTDTRGMNKRHSPQKLLNHKIQLLEVENGQLCAKCEMYKSRVPFSLIDAVSRNLSYKSRMLFKS